MCSYKNGGTARRTVENEFDVDHAHLLTALPSDDKWVLHYLIGKLASHLPEQLQSPIISRRAHIPRAKARERLEVAPQGVAVSFKFRRLGIRRL